MLSTIGWWIPVVQGLVIAALVMVACTSLFWWFISWAYPVPPIIVPYPPPAPNVTPSPLPSPQPATTSFTLAEALALTERFPTHGYRAVGDWVGHGSATTPDQRRSAAWIVIFEDTTGDPVLYLEIREGRIGLTCRSNADLALLLTSTEMREEIRKSVVV